MPTCGLSIVTRGMLYPPQTINPIVCDHPMITSVVEVRPHIVAKIPVPPSTPVDAPVILSAQDLKPRMSGKGPDAPTTGDTPKVLSAEDLRPTIRRAEEE